MNDYEIETDEYLKHGIRLFQGALLGTSEKDHALIYTAIVKPYGVMVDMGAGIGEMGALLQQIAPVSRVINVVNIKNQVEKMAALGREYLYSDYHKTPLDSGIADFVTFNESFGYGDIERLMQESARILKDKGFLVIKDFVPFKQTDGPFFETSWEYTFYPLSMYVRCAEKAGLRLLWAFQPTVFMERGEEFFYKSNNIQKWHKWINFPNVSCLMKFIKNG